MLFERRQRARHFELLFVAFHSQIASGYGTEEHEMLQMEPISYLKYIDSYLCRQICIWN